MDTQYLLESDIYKYRPNTQTVRAVLLFVSFYAVFVIEGLNIVVAADKLGVYKPMCRGIVKPDSLLSGADARFDPDFHAPAFLGHRDSTEFPENTHGVIPRLQAAFPP